MDLRTRWATIGAGTLLALAAIAALPPRPCDSDDRSLAKNAMCAYGSHGGATHAAVVDRMRNRLEQATRRRQLADSLLGSRGARVVTSGVVSVYYEHSLSADSARLWLGLAQRELGLLPGAGPGPGIKVVVLLQSDSAGAARRGNPDDGSRRWWYYPSLDRFATTAHGGACLVVLDLTVRRTTYRLQQQRPNLLDWCALYGRFGAPAPGVERWAASAFSLGWRDNASIAELVRDVSAGTARAVTDYRVLACQSRGGAVCLQYAGAAGTSRGLAFFQRETNRELLAWLLATANGTQFLRFWHAGGSLGDALEAGYGMPADHLLQQWTQQRFQTVRARPLTSTKVLLAGAVWFFIAMGAAFVAIQRRQVG